MGMYVSMTLSDQQQNASSFYTETCVLLCTIYHALSTVVVSVGNPAVQYNTQYIGLVSTIIIDYIMHRDSLQICLLCYLLL